MIFIGADHYYFELGLLESLKGSTLNPEEYLKDRLEFKTKVNLEASESFKWGLLWGQEIKLTKELKTDVITKKRVK